MRVTEFYSIAGPVDFVDVQLKRDNLLFTTTTALRNDFGSDLAAQALGRVSSFTTEVLRCRTSPHQADRAKGLRILKSGLNEPNETRLGYTKYGSKGHGWGKGMGSYLWDSLDNSLVQEGLLYDLEQLPLFLRHVGQDLMSDMTTRLAFPEFIQYTQQVVAQNPTMLKDLRKADFTAWDPVSRDWMTVQDVLPFVEGHHLLLVPNNWVSGKLLMAPRPFYNRFATTSVQDERVRYINGKPDAPLKRDLRREFPNVRELNTARTLKEAEHNNLLIPKYTAFVDEHYMPVGAVDLLRKTAA